MGRRRLLDWALVVAWAAVIFAFSATPNLSTGLGGWDLLLRKLAHTAEYALLAILILRALGTARWAALAAVLLAALYAVSDELHQTTVEGRRGAPLDVLIDTVGATLGVLAWRLVPWRRWLGRRRETGRVS